MPNDVKKEITAKKADVSKETKSTPTEPKTIAGVFQVLGQKGAKDRQELAKGIMHSLASRGITTNGKGKPILQERVLQQISAMIRDINMDGGKGRGHKTGAWWSKFKVVENDKEFKLVLKA